MSVQEVVQADGQWSLQLRNDTPGEICDHLSDYFSIIRVFSTTVSDVEVSDLPPFYSGVLLRRDGQYGCGGAGPNWYLGEPNTSGDQVGPIFETAVTYNSTTGTLTNWTTACATQAGLSVGTVGATSTKWAGSLQYVTPRVVLDPYMVAGFGGALEYRVGPSLNLNVGDRTELYKNPSDDDIEAVIVRGEVASRTDVDPEGVQAPEMDLSFSAEDLVRRVVLKGASTTSGSSVGAWTYKNPAGGTLDRIRYTINEQIATGDMTGALTRVLGQYRYLKRDLRVTVRQRPPHPWVVGDWCWFYEPEIGLYSLNTDALDFNGQAIFPVAVRVMEMTWQFHEGMGVYLDNTHQGGSVIDLTPYVEWENGDTTVTVGSVPRRLAYLPRAAA